LTAGTQELPSLLTVQQPSDDDNTITPVNPAPFQASVTSAIWKFKVSDQL